MCPCALSSPILAYSSPCPTETTSSFTSSTMLLQCSSDRTCCHDSASIVHCCSLLGLDGLAMHTWRSAQQKTNGRRNTKWPSISKKQALGEIFRNRFFCGFSIYMHRGTWRPNMKVILWIIMTQQVSKHGVLIDL